jgi:hypothetical protein
VRAGAAARDGAPVFIVGSMRSGTTLLRLMLNEHPQLAIPAESHFLAMLFDRFEPTARLDTAEVAEAIAIVTGTEPWQRDYAHDAAQLAAFVGPGPMTLPELIARVFRLEVGSDAARWGDKTPHYLNRVRALLTAFPEAQVVAIVRDPRDNYLSLAPRDWGVGSTPWEIGRYLARNGRLVRRWQEEYDEHAFTVVRYEDLVLDTESVLRNLCAHLEIPFDRGMSAFFQNAEQNVQQWELDMGAHGKLLRPPSQADVGRWRHEGSRIAHAEIEALTVDVLVQFGYERRVPRQVMPMLRAAARAACQLRKPFRRPV